MISVSGVISGGYPSSARTWTTSASTSASWPSALRSRSSAMACPMAEGGGRPRRGDVWGRAGSGAGMGAGGRRVEDVGVVDELALEDECGRGDPLEVEPAIHLGPREAGDQRLCTRHRGAACKW